MLVEKGYKVARVEQTETPQMMDERVKRSKHSFQNSLSQNDPIYLHRGCLGSLLSIIVWLHSFWDYALIPEGSLKLLRCNFQPVVNVLYIRSTYIRTVCTHRHINTYNAVLYVCTYILCMHMYLCIGRCLSLLSSMYIQDIHMDSVYVHKYVYQYLHLITCTACNTCLLSLLYVVVYQLLMYIRTYVPAWLCRTILRMTSQLKLYNPQLPGTIFRLSLLFEPKYWCTRILISLFLTWIPYTIVRLCACVPIC